MSAALSSDLKNPALSGQVSIGAITAKNKVFMCSLTRNRSIPTQIPNEDNLEYYKQRAKGGVGLIFSEGTLISPQGSEWPHAPGMFNEEHIAAWKTIVDAVHEEGVPIICQLWHVGRIAHPEQEEAVRSGKPVYAPSAIACRGGKFREIGNKPHAVPTAMPLEEIKNTLEDYRRAAEFCKRAGFDGIEVHSANGYLINEFLDTNTNTRTDEYGGSVENRCRFGLEVARICCGVYGSDRVGIKLNPCGGYNDVGMSLESTLETYTYYITELDKMGLAYFQLVKYLDVMDPKYGGVRRGTEHDILESYQGLIKNGKIVMNGGYDAQSAADDIEKGVDAVSFGVPWIANPDYYQRIQKGLELNIPKPKLFYTGDGVNTNGYTDYPFATSSTPKL